MPLLLMLLLLCNPALAARLQVQVETDQMTVGQSVLLEVQVVDGQATDVPRITVGDGLQVRYRGQGQSTSIVGLKATRVVRYSFQLTAIQKGAWTVGPVELNVDGEQLSNPPLRIVVQDQPEEAKARAEVVGRLSDSEPFLGEVVVFQATFRRREEALNIRWTPPETPGFVVEPSAEIEQNDRTNLVNGVEEAVLDLYLPLRATTPGEHTVSPALVLADMPAPADPRTGRRPVDLFGRYRTRTANFATNPMPVRVRPLPEEGRPADFSGLVGQFSMRATPSAGRVAQGESLTLTVEIDGAGVLSGFQLPPAPEGLGFRVYDDAPTVEAKATAEGLRSRAVFRRAIVPETEGELEIPGISFSVFDPQAEAYVPLQTPPIRVRVTPGDVGGDLESFAGGATDRRRDVAALGDDILPAPGSAHVANRTLQGAMPLLVGIPAIPALAWLALLGRGLADRRRADPWNALAQRALPTTPSERLAAAETLFRDAAGLALGCPPPSVDREKLAVLGETAVAIYRDLETARYGGGAGEGLVERVTAFVRSRGGR